MEISTSDLPFAFKILRTEKTYRKTSRNFLPIPLSKSPL